MIVMGSDHGAYELKGVLKAYLESQGKEVNDLGVYDATSVDYPDIAEKVCNEVKTGKYEFGILLCGTGIGISIAANKIDGIRRCRPRRESQTRSSCASASSSSRR